MDDTDIHKYNQRIKWSLIKIEKAIIPKENKEALMGFYRNCVADGISNGKLHRYLDDLVFMTRDKKKKYKDYDRKDIEEIIIKLEQSECTEWTKYSYKIGLRKFFKWFRGTEDFPPEVKWFKVKQKACNSKMPEDLLTEEEVKLIINQAQNSRDRALISTLYESGCRIFEIMTMRIKHVAFDKNGSVISVFGKTGSRRVRIVLSVSYLQKWLNEHPMNSDPNAFLWPKQSNPNSIVGYNRVRLLIQRLAKRAGIKKRVNPHNFRHARASYLANYLTESQLKEVFGWTQASKMASVYVHLSGKNTDNAILKVYGKVIEEEVKGGALLPSICIRCKTENEATNKFCKLCGIPVDKETQRELISNEARTAEASNIMDNLLQDKEVMELLAKKMLEKRSVIAQNR